MTNQGEDKQKPAQLEGAGPKGNEPGPQKDTTPKGNDPAEEKKATTPTPSKPGKEDSGESVPKSHYLNLQRAHTELKGQFEELQQKATNLDLNPLVGAMKMLRGEIESRGLEDQMWRVAQATEAGDAQTANRLAERELNRQLATLGLNPQTAPSQVMDGPDAVTRLHNLLLVRPFLGQTQQQPVVQNPQPTPPLEGDSEKIGGKSLEDLEKDWEKKHGLLNIAKAQPGGSADDLESVIDPGQLIRSGVQRRSEET